MKTTMKQLVGATIFALIFLAGNVNAKGTEAKVSGLEISETNLTLENWMVNDDVWSQGTARWAVEAADETLVLESWMIENTNWNLENNMEIGHETESDLVVENWMTDKNIWEK